MFQCILGTENNPIVLDMEEDVTVKNENDNGNIFEISKIFVT